MRVAITGGQGFTGHYLLPALAKRGHEAVSLEADVTDPAALADAVATLRPDAIVHLAARAFVAERDYAGFYAVNQVGSFNLLEAVAVAAPGTRVLLASTAQVYGAQTSGLLSEDVPTRPANHYALSKAAMESGSRFWADRLRIIVARPFNYTGVGQETRYLIPKIVDHFRRRAPQIDLGNLDVRRDFGDVRCVVEAYVLLLEADYAPEAINIATGSLASVRDVVARLETLTGHRIDVRVNPDFVRADDVPELGGDIGLLRAVAPGWQPRSLDDTLAWMLAA